MKKRILIVDAYNMIGNWPELKRLKKANRLEDARNQLLRVLSNYYKQIQMEIIVVFDAMYISGQSQKYEQYNLKIVWTDEGQTADSYIESLAGELLNPLTIVTVATSDQAEQWTIFSQGALRKPAWELYQDIKNARIQVTQATKKYQLQGTIKRRSPWDNTQLSKLAELRDNLSQES